MPQTPRATVLIPTYNRPDHVPLVLQALADQTEDGVPFSVVLVDDGSVPPVSVEPAAYPFLVHLVTLPENAGRAGARNAGLEAVDSPLTIFIDDDIRPQAGFVRAHVEAWQPGTCTVGLGEVIFAPEIPRDRLTTYLETRGIAKLDDDKPIPFKYFLTYNSSVPTELLREVGGFNGSLRTWGGEDLELGYRLAQAGAEFIRVPRAFALHAHRRTLRGVWEVSVRFAEGSMPHILETHPELVHLLRADVFGPGVYSRGVSLKRAAIRLATHRPLPEILLALACRLPGLPWPDAAYDYLIASAWRRGLDTAARRGLAESARRGLAESADRRRNGDTA